MKSLFEPARSEEVKQRLAQLSPESQKLWGKMNPAQTLAHCSLALELVLGERASERLFLGRIIGRMIKPMVLGNDEPLRRNSQSTEDLIVQDERDFGTERERLRALIDRFTAAGPEGCSNHPHSFFGRLTPQEWAILAYKHLDHHLRQFQV